MLRAGLALAGAALGLGGLGGAQAATRGRRNGRPCTKDRHCASGFCGPADASGRRVCQVPPPAVCTAGSDATSGARWTVCRADGASAWVSAVDYGGRYDALAICQQLGYRTLGQFGGTCAITCGFCGDGDTSCSSPGTETYNGESMCTGGILCDSVQWQCLA